MTLPAGQTLGGAGSSSISPVCDCNSISPMAAVMGRARFGYCGAVLLGQIMRTLREGGVPYAALDIRAVERKGLPLVSQMPVLVVVSGGFYAVKEPLDKYVAAGGKLLWIGGCDQGLLGQLSRSLKPAAPNLLPVSNKYEDANREVVAKVSIRFLNEFERSLGKAPWTFVNNPNTFGWTTPRCGLQVASGAGDIKALAAVSDGADTMTIAAALSEKGTVRHVFLPQYLLLPYTLTTDPPMDFSKPSLDSVGRKIVLGSVEMLSPELSGAGSSASTSGRAAETRGHRFGEWPAISAVIAEESQKNLNLDAEDFLVEIWFKPLTPLKYKWGHNFLISKKSSQRGRPDRLVVNPLRVAAKQEGEDQWRVEIHGQNLRRWIRLHQTNFVTPGVGKG